MGGLPVFEDIAHTSHGPNQRYLSRAIHLAAQAVDMHVNHIRVRLNAHAPHFIQNHGARHHAARISAEILQENEFLLGELQNLPATRSLPPEQIQLKILNAEASGLAGRGTIAFEQVAEARQQLGQRKRLGEIVVSALFEPAHAIVDRPAGRQDQDGGIYTQLTQLQDQADSVLIGKPEIDNEDVEGALGGEPHSRFAVGRSFHLVARFLKRTSQEGLDFDFVLNEQEAHDWMLFHRGCLFRVFA